MKPFLLALVLGLAGGAAGGYFVRPAVERATSHSTEVEGVVVDERRDEDRLVLTLRAGDETILASFHERAGDVADLVSPGDLLTVRVGTSAVFADEVPIVRLRRAADMPMVETDGVDAGVEAEHSEAERSEVGDEGDEATEDAAHGGEGDDPGAEHDESADDAEVARADRPAPPRRRRHR